MLTFLHYFLFLSSHQHIKGLTKCNGGILHAMANEILESPWHSAHFTPCEQRIPRLQLRDSWYKRIHLFSFRYPSLLNLTKNTIRTNPKHLKKRSTKLFYQRIPPLCHLLNRTDDSPLRTHVPLSLNTISPPNTPTYHPTNPKNVQLLPNIQHLPRTRLRKHRLRRQQRRSSHLDLQEGRKTAPRPSTQVQQSNLRQGTIHSSN
jgi:hypothetical protein